MKAGEKVKHRGSEKANQSWRKEKKEGKGT